MAPLVHRLFAEPESFEVKVCVTAQHREMLDQVLAIFEIVPDFDLNLMKPGQNLLDITSDILLGMKDVLIRCKPDVVLVHGDTTTTLAAAMACFYAGVPIGHVEAGLRTYDLHAPFPEEFNRQVAGKVARWHFAPTAASCANLLAEGVPANSIFVTGNTVIDALHWVLGRIEKDICRKQGLTMLLNTLLPFDWVNERFVLITGHRRENFGDGFVQICEAVRDLAKQFSDVHFVYPVHLNPNVQQPVRSMLGTLPNLHLIQPLEYEPFVYLLKHCYLVLTDSGGIQEEAPSLGKPVLVMRKITERPEAVQAGIVQLVGADRKRIVDGVTRLLLDMTQYRAIARSINPYGDGQASERIAAVLRSA